MSTDSLTGFTYDLVEITHLTCESDVEYRKQQGARHTLHVVIDYRGACWDEGRSVSTDICIDDGRARRSV